MARIMFYLVHGAFLVSLTTSFPLHMWPARQSVWELVARKRPFVGLGYWATTYGLLAMAALLAAVCPSVWVALQWIGATAGVLISFIMPGVVMARQRQALTVVLGGVLIVCGMWSL